MIVLDASAAVDLLLDLQPSADRIAERLASDRARPCAPHLIDAEVAQVLRRFVRTGRLEPERAVEGIDDLLAMRLQRYGHKPLLPRAFELRDNTTVYDALYLALAEAVDATLLTRDGRLTSVPGCSARVDVVE